MKMQPIVYSPEPKAAIGFWIFCSPEALMQITHLQCKLSKLEILISGPGLGPAGLSGPLSDGLRRFWVLWSCYELHLVMDPGGKG